MVSSSGTAGATLLWAFAGRVGYADALRIQQHLRSLIAEQGGSDVLLLLEHPAVITLGRSGCEAHVLASDAQLQRLGIARYATERGGGVTYHGPGQLVGYPVRRVGRAVAGHVKGMADAIADLLSEHGVQAWWSSSEPGVWTSEGKIAAVGVDARGGVATHGFALNVDPCLDHYRVIVPCGLRKPVTSMKRLGVQPVPSLAAVARRMATLLAGAYGCAAVEILPGALLSGVTATTSAPDVVAPARGAR